MEVIIWDYAKWHFIKAFKKKYKSFWDETYEIIKFMCERNEKFLKTAKLNEICKNEGHSILKWEFSIVWSKISTKDSGNRFITYINETSDEAKILLVYKKDNIKWSNETQWWKSEIKENYNEIKELFPEL